MKVAVTSQGTDLEAGVDPRFGRCRYFVLVDTETGDFRAVDNAQNLNAPSGAGIQAAQNVVNLGAEAVLTGHCGPKAFGALSAAGVKVYVGVEGTVREAVKALQAGELQVSAGADVEGHWV